MLRIEDQCDPAGLLSSCLVLSRGMSSVWGWSRRLVFDRFAGSEQKRLPLHEERWEAAGKFGHVGWHTFRHTYRSWLDDTGHPSAFNKS